MCCTPHQNFKTYPTPLGELISDRIGVSLPLQLHVHLTYALAYAIYDSNKSSQHKTIFRPVKEG